ncbi:marine proteobacterial sortase target protein [Aestuariicella sp. G3-2]|uniref:marine proteobacterial sortase target protein n=1 Tax=Pseudomaricurvus albidus TaxID=2842452 RepID=UPI001C0D8422|nr:marine proteobacterial sortase target protein [Aestuariicella albida]MBU3069383.1 marine proteobacterial sortase target protein [Aestuariicella albida]
MSGRAGPHTQLMKDSYPLQRSRLPIWISALWCVFCLAGFQPASANLTPIESTTTEQTNSGQMEFRGDGGEVLGAPLLSTRVQLTITGMIATTTYVQTFHNTSDTWVEGRYVFPLPETAAVNGMTMRIGDRLIKGEIKEKQAAKRMYQQAKQSGKRASLVEQQRPNVFSQTVANIAPHEKIEVTLSYRQTVDFNHGRFSLRLPLTITPRYIPGVVSTPTDGAPEETTLSLDTQGWGWAKPTDQVPDADKITPPMTTSKTTDEGAIRNPVSIEIDLNAGLPLARIDSPYHDIVIQKNGTEHQISLSAGQAPMDRDFVLAWQSVQQKTPQAALFTEQVISDEGGNSDYLLLMLLPPQTPHHSKSGPLHAPEQLAREVQFIIDTSGSMGGTSIEQAKASLQLALSTLSSQDRFNIVEFNTSFQHFSPTSEPATADNIRKAQAFVQNLEAGGGTEMYAPLNAVLSQTTDETYLKQIVFITDGSVGNESALFHLIETRLDHARLFMVGIGSAPNSYFMRKSAQFGRGTFTHIGDLREVSEKMSTLFEQLESPVLRDIHIEWPEGLSVEAYPRKHPDLYRGQPLLLKAKADTDTPNGLQGEVKLSGKMISHQWSQSITLPTKQSHTDKRSAKGIASLWARDKISDLLDQKHAGISEADIKPQVLKVALAHQLMSPYTSFVAVDQIIARPENGTLKQQEVPNLLAKGQKPSRHSLSAQAKTKTLNTHIQRTSAHSYPQTALGLNGILLMASVCLLMALLLLMLARKPQPSSTLEPCL